jgi:hypothetical protein
MKRSQCISARFARFRLGRAALHFVCLARGQNVRWHSHGIIRELFWGGSRRQFRAEKQMERPVVASQPSEANSIGPAMRINSRAFLMGALLSHCFPGLAFAETSELRLLPVSQVDSLQEFVSDSILPASPIRLGDARAFGQAISPAPVQITGSFRTAAPEPASIGFAGVPQVHITRRARGLVQTDVRDLLTATIQTEFLNLPLKVEVLADGLPGQTVSGRNP